MNIQRYTSYSGVKTRVIAYLKCRSLVCSSHIDFRLCRQNNHISMYNTYIQCVSHVVIHIYYQPMMLIGYCRSHVRKINVKHQPMYSRYLETEQNLFDFNIYNYIYMSIQLHKCPKEICSTVPQFPGMFNPKVSTLWPARGLRDSGTSTESSCRKLTCKTSIETIMQETNIAMENGSFIIIYLDICSICR